MAFPHQTPRAELRLPSGKVLPDLQIVGRSQVHLHEDCDQDRVDRLIGRIRADGILRNPPLAASLPDEGFVVLDGANRTSALLALEAPVLPLQVVDYADPAVRLEVWHHLLVRPSDLSTRLRAQGLTLLAASPFEAARQLAERTIACYILTPAGGLTVSLPSEQLLAQTLAAVVGTYKTTNHIYRVTDTNLDTLRSEYEAAGELVVFPTFTKRDIVEVARAPVKLPTGITRHLIPGRALRLNLPLSVLTSPGDVAAKNRWLQEDLHRKLLDHQIRYYPEATFLFDE
ncbi:MAG: hypothetical protein AUH31_01625 [Armatimonadetes bacterium 13_1_40CM_64_14]|nr:MAG: hypothetical protein AUH31_01625 [Armatimonadetes bacterium 13_1_40CM_64_14]